MSSQFVTFLNSQSLGVFARSLSSSAFEIRRPILTFKGLVFFVAALLATIPSLAQTSALNGLDTPGTRQKTSHMVSEGDTLSDIATRHGVTVDTLMRLNNLDSDIIHSGDRLAVGHDSGSYTIIAGDTLWNLALRFGTTPAELKRLNGMSRDLIIPGTIIKIPSTAPKANSPTGPTLLTARQFLIDKPKGSRLDDSPSVGATVSPPNGISISPTGKAQLERVVAYARANHTGRSAGYCFNSVWRYLTSSGYGKLRNWGDLPDMQSGEARNFAEFMNAGRSNLDRAGLQRIDNIDPPIKNPHDPRIPTGAVIVVAPESYGTSHPTAGDIVVSAGGGRFINDGPNMDYGTRSSWYGKILGVYVPR